MIFVSALVMLNLGGLSVAWRSAGWLVNRIITIAALVRVELELSAMLTSRVEMCSDALRRLGLAYLGAG